jgi:hypothetical protein
MKLQLPEATDGAWAVERFVISEDDAKLDRIRSAFKPGARSVEPGAFHRLMRNGRVIMSNTQAELRDLMYFQHRATGGVLINGLGLGVAVQMALAKPDVHAVTVIELAPEVVRLVGEHITDPRLTMIGADAYTWQPPKGQRWNVVWHDIWDDICTDNLDGMKALHRKYGRRCDWQGSWCRELCERYAR